MHQGYPSANCSQNWGCVWLRDGAFRGSDLGVGWRRTPGLLGLEAADKRLRISWFAASRGVAGPQSVVNKGCRGEDPAQSGKGKVARALRICTLPGLVFASNPTSMKKARPGRQRVLCPPLPSDSCSLLWSPSLGLLPRTPSYILYFSCLTRPTASPRVLASGSRVHKDLQYLQSGDGEGLIPGSAELREGSGVRSL